MEFSYVSLPEATQQDNMEVRKGPWTAEEDALLSDYVTIHGEGRWNSVARCSGLKRTGKSCRLRWLNYLRPDVRRGDISLQEQVMILELHYRWGNRWSKIAQHLPGRTDNEIKNYWRTRVQKQAKQLKCDVNSNQFRHALRHVWIPRLMERIQAQPQQLDYSVSDSAHHHSVSPTTTTTVPVKYDDSPSSSAAGVVVDNNSNNETSMMRDVLEADVWLEEEEEESVWKWSEENIWFLQQQLFD